MILLGIIFIVYSAMENTVYMLARHGVEIAKEGDIMPFLADMTDI